jgi:hypothetical protein
LRLYSNKFKFDLVSGLGLLSIVLTFSSQGIFFVLFYLIVILIKNFRLKGFFIVIALISLILGTLYLADIVIIERFADGIINNPSGEIRMNVIENMLQNIQGIGFSLPEFILSDTSNLGYWWIYFGFFSLFIIYAIYKPFFSLGGFILILPLMTSKIPGVSPYFWLIHGISIIYFAKNYNEKKDY